MSAKDDEAAEEPGEDEEGAPQEDADPEIEEMKRKVQEMEEEAAKLKEMQQEVEKQMASGGAASANATDDTSVYVGQVDYEATPEELQAHFASCGTINRVTILCDKFTGKPKGHAYIEFNEKESIENAVLLDDSLFKGRQLKVMPKRVNLPNFKGGGKGRKGKGGRFRGGGRRGGRRGRSFNYYY